LNSCFFVEEGFEIKFLNEEGIDAGGLTREWINLLLKDVYPLIIFSFVLFCFF
jgi:hypothetical protein